MGISSIGSYPNSTDLLNVAVESLKAGAARRSGDSVKSLFEESGDVLELSAEGQAAADAASSLSLGSLFGAADDGSLSITDMETAQQQIQAQVESKLNRLFAEHDIDTTQEIRLQVGADGRVIVANDHPQRDQIEQLFADDPELRNDFVQAQSMAEFLGAAQEAIAFQQAYARDPEAAVAQFSYLFDATQKASTSLVIRGDSYQMFYERPGMEAVEIGGED